jgi:predicted nucleic acid-binding protein
MIRTTQPRLFLDSNVLLAGLVSPWGVDKAVLSLCAARICRMVLADVVRLEVERNLALHAPRLGLRNPEHVLDIFRRLIQLSAPETVPFPDPEIVRANRLLIRHEPDLPVLLSAISAAPDWLLTNNTRHFTRAVSTNTGLRIATPAAFFRVLSKAIA